MTFKSNSFKSASRWRKARVVATLTIDQPGEMTESGRRDVARWLEQQRDLLLGEPKNLSRKYRARFVCSSPGRSTQRGIS